MTINRRMDTEDVTHTSSGILLSHKKEPNNVICTSMVTTRDSHTKWSKKDKRQTSYDITYKWNLKYDINEPIYETETEPWA